MRSAGLLLTALLLTAAPASAQAVAPERASTATHLAIGVYGVAAFVDISVTEYLMGKGELGPAPAPYREGNPALRWAVERGPATAAVVKGSLHVAIGAWLLRDQRAHPTRTFWTALALGAAQIAVDVHNVRTIRNGTR